MPSAISRMVSSAAAELVSSSLTSTPPRRRVLRAGSVAGGVSELGHGGSPAAGRASGRRPGAPGVLDELGRDRLGVDDRVAPSSRRMCSGSSSAHRPWPSHMIGSMRMVVRLLMRPPVPRSAAASTARARRRTGPPGGRSISPAKTSRALARKRAAPSG